MKRLLALLAIAGLFTARASASNVRLGYDTPRGMAFDSSGNLLVANPEAGNIVKFTPDGRWSTFASGLVHPFGLAFDNAGNLFVADVQSDARESEGRVSVHAKDRCSWQVEDRQNTSNVGERNRKNRKGRMK